jgi:hypothetical protein
LTGIIDLGIKSIAVHFSELTKETNLIGFSHIRMSGRSHHLRRI